ncbi:energy transducer TonB [Silvibacterium acidisoli]|uniref:energy transducer TonB n=1 Tax=Acidobacteriaceae bacterium ZG23-2 TaxID=2883246 RepID=UPI00406C20C5
MASSPKKNAEFGLLPEPEGRLGSFGVSMVANIAVGALILLFAAARIHEVKVRKENTATLIFPLEQPKPYVPPVPKVKIIPPPPKVIEPPKPVIQPPKPVVEPPKPVEVKVPTPEQPKIAPAPPKAVTPPPQPKVGLFKSPTPTQVANNTAPPSVKTGGFGDPSGVKPNPNATKAPTVAAVGAFNAAPGPSAGAGAARQGSVKGVAFGSGVANGVPGGKDTRGTVASAGFSNGVVGGTGKPGGTGQVAQAGSFGTGYGSAPAAQPKAQQAAATPIVVLSKPRATYTAEARQLKIEGDVTLQVRFTADGHVQVLQVLSGLGHGLDQQARSVAEGIQFKPATRDGHPVDQVTVIHITFQLA